MRVLVVHNTDAGSAEDDTSIIDALAAGGHDAVLVDPGADWLQQVDGFDVVAAAGGDGTIAEVVTTLAGARTPVAVLAMGTANNIARSLGVASSDPLVDAQRWDLETISTFDVGSVSGESWSTRFVESVGGGLFADVLVDARRRELRLGRDADLDEARQLLADRIVEARPATWRIDIDGSVRTEQLIGVEVANTREIGPNLAIAPDADCADGMVDVVLIRADDRAELIEAVTSGVSPTLTRIRATSVILAAPADVGVHVDDVIIERPVASSIVLRVCVEAVVRVIGFAD